MESNNNRRATLTTLQARTALALINKSTVALDSQNAIEMESKQIIETLIKTFPANYPAEIIPALWAFTLSNVGKKAIKDNTLTAYEYIALLAESKRDNAENRKDYGAFGDLFEILARLALVKKQNLINWRLLTVKDINRPDIISNKYGVIECGTNGKTWTNGTLFDYMAGDYTSVIYGVFMDEDKQAVYELCASQQIERAIDYIAQYSAYWPNKYDFQHDMDNLTRGKGITEKGGNIQCQFNIGKYDAFINALEDGKIKALKDVIA